MRTLGNNLELCEVFRKSSSDFIPRSWSRHFRLSNRLGNHPLYLRLL